VRIDERFAVAVALHERVRERLALAVGEQRADALRVGDELAVDVPDVIGKREHLAVGLGDVDPNQMRVGDRLPEPLALGEREPEPFALGLGDAEHVKVRLGDRNAEPLALSEREPEPKPLAVSHRVGLAQLERAAHGDRLRNGDAIYHERVGVDVRVHVAERGGVGVDVGDGHSERVRRGLGLGLVVNHGIVDAVAERVSDELTEHVAIGVALGDEFAPGVEHDAGAVQIDAHTGRVHVGRVM